MERKLDKLLEAMAAQDWRKALSIAAKFPQLGIHKDDIKRGHEAFTNAAFYSQIGKDPQTLIQLGIQALKDRYAKAFAEAYTSAPSGDNPSP